MDKARMGVIATHQSLAANLLAVADGAILAHKLVTLAVRDTALLARAWVVTGMGCVQANQPGHEGQQRQSAQSVVGGEHG